MAYNKEFEFSCTVRDYHYYRSIWDPEPEQILNCYHERNNPFDRCAIKCCEIGKKVTIGHMPIEISRVTKFFIDRGATITAQLVGNHYGRSPLVQGGLEIPCKITATIPGTVSNLLCMEKYKELVTNLYIEPKNEEVLGSFLRPRNDVPLTTPTSPKKKKVEKKKTYVMTRDIRDFFGQGRRSQKHQRVTKKDNSNNVKVITID